ncbi:hypothetical protein [Crocosphaera sp.]|uniref:hypothetical protein n=1 Tax=Crocosphaera sp. TaxID=2729996 RepID=UPI003F21EBBA
MSNLKISDLSFFKEVNSSSSQILGGNCSVNYTFNGTCQDFDEVLQELKDRGYHEQAAHLESLENNGCITMLG